MLARNVAHQALVQEHTVRFTTAGQLLGDLAALDSDAALRRRLRHFAAPDLLVIDEIGYLSYSNRHADWLFELVSRRYPRCHYAAFSCMKTALPSSHSYMEWGLLWHSGAVSFTATSDLANCVGAILQEETGIDVKVADFQTLSQQYLLE